MNCKRNNEIKFALVNNKMPQMIYAPFDTAAQVVRAGEANFSDWSIFLIREPNQLYKIPNAGFSTYIGAPIKLVIFDMAGTTIKDDGRVSSVFMETLKEFDLDNSRVLEKVNSLMGMSKREVFAKLGASKEAFSVFDDKLKKSFKKNPAKEIDGATDLFDKLNEKDIKISFNTGFHRDIVEMIFDQLAWKYHYVCSDDVSRGRPFPYMIFESMKHHLIDDVNSVCVFGDTIKDVEAAINARCGCIYGVLSGTGKEEDFIHDHKRIIVYDSISEVDVPS